MVVLQDCSYRITFAWDKTSNDTHLALQLIGLLGPGNVHVRWQCCVLVEDSPVIGLSCQVLSLLSMADIQHVQRNTGAKINIAQ